MTVLFKLREACIDLIQPIAHVRNARIFLVSFFLECWILIGPIIETKTFSSLERVLVRTVVVRSIRMLLHPF